MVEPLPPLDESTDFPSTSKTSSTPDPSPGGSTGVGAGRHLVSLLLSLTFVPAAYVLLDYSSYRAAVRAAELDESMPSKVLITMAVALGCLFVAAAAGRVSGLGPLVAGLIWGGALTAWLFFDFSSFAEALRDAPDSYDQFGFGLLATGFALFPTTTGLLLGAAVAGRWRRPAGRRL